MMRKYTPFVFLLVLLLTASCFVMSVNAEEIQAIDWSTYSYEELLTIRNDLDAYISEAERQYAIENGNRVITLNESEPVIYKGKTLSFTVDIKRIVDDAPETTELIWTSSDETIAKVSSKGVVTGVGHGTAVITCTAADDEYIFADATVNVVLPVEKLEIESTSDTLLLSEQSPNAADTTLHCVVLPENAYIQDVIWTSSNEDIATVDETGRVHAVAPGAVKITATSQDAYSAKPKSVTYAMTVLQAVSGIELSESAITLNVRSSQNLTATVLPENASKPSLVWESSNPEIATVTAAGRVSAVSPGTATIMCMANDGSGIQAQCEVTVIQMVDTIKFENSAKEITLNKNESLTLNVTVSPEQATNKALIWESSDSSVATVDNNGNVTAINGGAATITCTATDGSEKTASINIYVPSIAVDEPNYSVVSKDGLEIAFKFYGESGNLSFSPETSKLFYASLNQDGEQGTLTIIPIKAGTGTITLMDSGDKRSTVKLSITIEHSACYDSTSYPVGNYMNIMRSPQTYKGSQMSIYGRVLQISKGLFSTVMRVATSGRWNNIFYVTCSNSQVSGIIEDDYISVYGECDGTETYTTIMGASVTIPALDAEKIYLGKH